MRISLIGPGDVEYHFQQLLGMSKEEVERHIGEIGEVLAKSGSEIILVPDKGICLAVSERYKNSGGKKVLGAVPMSDKEYGIKHIEPFMKKQVGGKKLFDEFIDAGDWYRLDAGLAAMGYCALLLGKSLGSMGELNLGFYLNNLLSKSKPLVKAKKSNLWAGKNMPFIAIIYLPFVKGKLDFETESYIKKSGGSIFYVNGPAGLKQVLIRIEKDFRKRI